MRRLCPLLVAFVIACAPATSSPTPTVAPATSAAATASATVAPTPPATASASPIALPTFAYIAAAGNGVVWTLVAGTRLFISTDRGGTWTERSLPIQSNPTEIAFVSADEGWLYRAGSPATQCQSQSVALWHTDDGAKTWQQLTPTGIADAQCKDHLAFRDPLNGYLLAHDPNGAPAVYRTADGGKTWAASAKLPDPPGFTSRAGGFTLTPLAIADFVSVQFAYAAAQGAGRMSGYVFKSTDGGATWTFTSTPPANEFGVTFLTPARWIAWMLPPPSAETTDSGSTWHPFQSDYQQAAPIAPQIVFGDANTGYATVRGAIQRSIDGGAHWSSIKTPGT